jgi:DNA-binding transcriptional MerR regulator
VFKIGEFSRIARVSARLLRFYDELNLLKPGVVDAATGYRFYTISQLQRLNRILVLKELGLSLEQIGGVINEEASADQLRAMLLVRRSDAERALAEEAARLRQIEARIAQLETGVPGDLDDVLIRAEPARRVLTLRETLGSFADARGIIGQLVQQVPKQIPRDVIGTLIGIAHSAEFEPDSIDVELGFVLNGTPPATLPRLGSRALGARDQPAVPHQAGCGRRARIGWKSPWWKCRSRWSRSVPGEEVGI